MAKWVKVNDSWNGGDLAEESRAAQVAAMAVAGANVHTIALNLKIDDKTAKKILNSDDCKAILRSLYEEAFVVARAQLVTESRKRVQQAFAVLDKHLKKGNINAAIQVFKMIDKEDKNTGQTGDTVIQIAMPREVKADDAVINVTPEIADGKEE